MTKRLTEAHPLSKKYSEVVALMDKLQIKFYWDGYHLVVTDTKTNVEAYLKNAEGDEYEMEVPTFAEPKLISKPC